MGKITYFRAGYPFELTKEFTLYEAANIYATMALEVNWFTFQENGYVYIASHNNEGVNFTIINDKEYQSWQYNWRELNER